MFLPDAQRLSGSKKGIKFQHFHNKVLPVPPNLSLLPRLANLILASLFKPIST
jgi:hypothetical protein